MKTPEAPTLQEALAQLRDDARELYNELPEEIKSKYTGTLRGECDALVRSIVAANAALLRPLGGMTLQDRIVVSAYTGFLMVQPFGLVHGYIERKLGRPVWTHEFASPKVMDEVREAVRPDFLKLCGTEVSHGG